MNIEEYRDYCLAKKAVTEEFPFDANTLVFKVLNKMFALCNVENFISVNLKCDPERAIELREQYTGINSGFHMNKKHWNTIKIDGSVDDDLIYTLIDHSYDCVIKGMSKKAQEEFKNA